MRPGLPDGRTREADGRTSHDRLCLRRCTTHPRARALRRRGVDSRHRRRHVATAPLHASDDRRGAPVALSVAGRPRRGDANRAQRPAARDADARDAGAVSSGTTGVGRHGRRARTEGCFVTRPSLTLFLCGDVMTGRGIAQVLPHPSDPRLYEPSVASATRYVELAERANGPIVRPVDFAYVWGDALDELERAHPDARIIDLETSVTTSDQRWDKGIHYRMHPANVPCLTAARIDCCVLSNNHVLDWGYAGLVETIETLRRAGLRRSAAARIRLRHSDERHPVGLGGDGGSHRRGGNHDETGREDAWGQAGGDEGDRAEAQGAPHHCSRPPYRRMRGVVWVERIIPREARSDSARRRRPARRCG
jgi:hypothetical protein